jgi:hypothetical protein
VKNILSKYLKEHSAEIILPGPYFLRGGAFWSEEEIREALNNLKAGMAADYLRHICEKKDVDYIIKKTLLTLREREKGSLSQTWGRLQGVWKDQRERENSDDVMRSTFIQAAGLGRIGVLNEFAKFLMGDYEGKERKAFIVEVWGEALHRAIHYKQEKALEFLVLCFHGFGKAVKSGILTRFYDKGSAFSCSGLLAEAARGGFGYTVEKLIDSGYYTDRPEEVSEALSLLVDRNCVAAVLKVLSLRHLFVSPLPPKTVGEAMACIIQENPVKLLSVFAGLTKEEYGYAMIHCMATGTQENGRILSEMRKKHTNLTLTKLELYSMGAASGYMPLLSQVLEKVIEGDMTYKNAFPILFEQAALNNQRDVMCRMLECRHELTLPQLQQVFYTAIRNGDITLARKFLYRESLEMPMDISFSDDLTSSSIDYNCERAGFSFKAEDAVREAISSKNIDMVIEVVRYLLDMYLPEHVTGSLLYTFAQEGMLLPIELFVEKNNLPTYEAVAVSLEAAIGNGHWKVAHTLISYFQRCGNTLAPSWRKAFVGKLKEGKIPHITECMTLGNLFSDDEILPVFGEIFAGGEATLVALRVLLSKGVVSREQFPGRRISFYGGSMTISYSQLFEVFLLAMEKNRSSENALCVEAFFEYFPAVIEERRRDLLLHVLERGHQNYKGYNGVIDLFFKKGYNNKDFLDSCFLLIGTLEHSRAYDIIGILECSRACNIITHEMKGYTPSLELVKRVEDAAMKSRKYDVVRILKPIIDKSLLTEMSSWPKGEIENYSKVCAEVLSITFSGDIDADMKILGDSRPKMKYYEHFINEILASDYEEALRYYVIFPEAFVDGEAFNKLCDYHKRRYDARGETVKGAVVASAKKSLQVYREAYESFIVEKGMCTQKITKERDILALYSRVFFVAVRDGDDSKAVVAMNETIERFCSGDPDAEKVYLMKEVRRVFLEGGISYEERMKRVEDCRKRIMLVAQV